MSRIGVAVRDYDEASATVAPLEALSYTYRGEYGVAWRHYFVKGSPRTRHLHGLEHKSLEWRNHLRFRDHLRAYPEAAAAYEVLKLQLAGRFSEDREAYADDKHTFLRAILNRAD